MKDNLRNFVIIAHIDSGKSTLADRLLETTGTVEAHKMRPQYLDRLPLERERGITIKMTPVRMTYHAEFPISNNQFPKLKTENSKIENSDSKFILNLIDTPGHSDFSYEVSRALVAVEGAILLVDATKGIQAQTLSTLRAALKAGLTIVGAVNKVDLDLPQLPKVIQSVAALLGRNDEDIFRISAKTGLGVAGLLRAVVEQVPPPSAPQAGGWRSGLQRPSVPTALIFDSIYDDHRGIIAFVRVFHGKFQTGDAVQLIATAAKFKIKELGYFSPEFVPGDHIDEGEIGYIATGLKVPALVKIGDTIAGVTGHGSRVTGSVEALPGYKEPAPVVFISFYPDGATKFDDLFKALGRLQLNDAAISFEPDANEALGRGLKVGFLGQLHFEITASRLREEFELEFMTSFPSIAYRVRDKNGERLITQPQDFPDSPESAWQPMIALQILTPQRYLSHVVSIKDVFDLTIGDIESLGDNLIIHARMPLAELIRDFDDRLKSASSGFASFSYERDGEEKSDIEKIEILIAGEVMPELTRVVARKDVEREARATTERLKELLPKQQFSQAIQAKSQGRIIARETVVAMKKELGNFGKNGGDRTRKMKLWKKQERGKERLESTGRVRLTPAIFRDLLKK